MAVYHLNHKLDMYMKNTSMIIHYKQIRIIRFMYDDRVLIGISEYESQHFDQCVCLKNNFVVKFTGDHVTEMAR